MSTLETSCEIEVDFTQYKRSNIRLTSILHEVLLYYYILFLQDFMRPKMRA